MNILADYSLTEKVLALVSSCACGTVSRAVQQIATIFELHDINDP
jgi:hypothetical protein